MLVGKRELRLPPNIDALVREQVKDSAFGLSPFKTFNQFLVKAVNPSFENVCGLHHTSVSGLLT